MPSCRLWCLPSRVRLGLPAHSIGYLEPGHYPATPGLSTPFTACRLGLLDMETAKPYVDAAKQRIPPQVYEKWERANGILQEFITM